MPPDQRAENTCHFGIPRGTAKDQIIAELEADQSLFNQRVDIADRLVIDPAVLLRRFTGDEATKEGIDIVIDSEGHRLGCIKDRRVVENGIAKTLFCPLRDQLAGGLAPGPARCTGRLVQRLADHPARITIIQRLHRQIAGRIQSGAVKRDFERHIMLEEARDAFGENRDKQRYQKGQRNADGDPAIELEPLLAIAACRKAGCHPFRGDGWRDHVAVGISHIALYIS